jgi:peptidoglycan biosynthesis protein MviN/MurJ (putative lipid II flippase)
VGSQAALVLLLTLLASALGFSRELATAAVFGTSTSADAVALIQVYVEGVATFMLYGLASQVLVPILVRTSGESPARGSELISNLLGWIGAVGTPVALITWIRPDWIAQLLAPFASASYHHALLPLIVAAPPTFVCLAAAGVMVGALRARDDFYTPVVGRGLFSAVTAVCIWGFGRRYGTSAAATGLLAGAVCQAAVAWWQLWRTKWPWSRPALRSESLWIVASSAWPVLLALFVTQLLVFGVQRALTSDAPTGDFAATNYAQRLLGIVQLLNLSVSTVAATDLARVFRDGGLTRLMRRVLDHLEALTFLLAPATILLLALSPVLVDAAFHHGSFTDSAAADTALILRVLAFALLPGGVGMLLQLIFTSSGRPVLVLAVAVPMVLTVWGTTIVLKPVLGPTLLAAGFVSGVVVMMIVSLVVARRLGGGGHAIDDYLGYATRLAGRVVAAGAVASIAPVLSLGPRHAGAWLVGAAPFGVTVTASALFSGIFLVWSVIGRDPGLARLQASMRGLLARVGGTDAAF